MRRPDVRHKYSFCVPPFTKALKLKGVPTHVSSVKQRALNSFQIHLFWAPLLMHQVLFPLTRPKMYGGEAALPFSNGSILQRQSSVKSRRARSKWIINHSHSIELKTRATTKRPSDNLRYSDGHMNLAFSMRFCPGFALYLLIRKNSKTQPPKCLPFT